ncbi:MAG: Ca2+:H+ antiporter [Chloroflexota bacterium]|jgi:Ca2+:H+ antiporter|nr:Ca2+:H+ antiporter [Chloroflexota bacterium]
MNLKPSLNWLLVFIPVSIFGEVARIEVLAFVGASLAIIPLSGLIGEATEELAYHVGPRLGGLLNATFGNLTELIVASLLVLDNQFDVAKASLTGSIIGNLLLVLGLAFVVGGVGRSEQRFSARSAAVHSASLVLAVVALLMPAILRLTSPHVSDQHIEVLSALVAGVLVISYVATIAFTQVTHTHLFGGHEASGEPSWTRRRAIIVLLAAAIAVGVESEFLVSSLQPALGALHLPTLFVGLIVIPIIGNAAEHSSAVIFAVRNRMNITLEIAIGSSSQVALFVAPAVIFISLVLGHPMNFVFTAFEIVTVALATLIVTVVCADGRSNWLEGAQLLGTYVIIAAAAFFVSG